MAPSWQIVSRACSALDLPSDEMSNINIKRVKICAKEAQEETDGIQT